MKTLTRTFPSNLSFEVWFKVTLLPRLKAAGVKGVHMSVAERHVPRGPYKDKEMYYYCEIPELGSCGERYHIYVKS